MGTFERFFTDPVGIALTVVLVLYLIKEAYGLYSWYKDRANDYHRGESGKENFKRQVQDIACVSQEHTAALQQIGAALEGINDRLDKIEEDRKEQMDKLEEERKKDTVSNARAWLFQLYENLKDRETLTMNEYETFNALAERYLAAGGNSVFRDKLIPAILSIPIDEER